MSVSSWYVLPTLGLSLPGLVFVEKADNYNGGFRGSNTTKTILSRQIKFKAIRARTPFSQGLTVANLLGVISLHMPQLPVSF